MFQFRGVIDPLDVNLREYLKDKSIFKENLNELSAKGVFVKESSKIKSCDLKSAIIEMEAEDELLEKQDPIIFLSGFFEHIEDASKKEYYARDISTPPQESSGFLNSIKSIISPREEQPGVNTPMFYVGGKYSNTALHDEDGSLASINILIIGKSKVWLAVDYTMKVKLITSFANYLRTEGKIKNICPQMLRHKLYVASPSLLDQWGINYAIFEQKPGDLVFLRGGTYHFVVNKGLNIAEAINYASAEWNCYAGISMPACKCKESNCFDVEPDRSMYAMVIPSKSVWHLCKIDNCNKRFKIRRALEEHEKKVHCRTDNYVCDVCKKKLKTKSGIRRHVKTHSNHAGFHECKICKKSVKQLSNHMRTHNVNDRENCPTCGKSFSKKHFSSHASNCKIQCSDCGKKFSSKRYLTLHCQSCTLATARSGSR